MSVRVTWVVVAEPRRATLYGITRGMARLREIETLEAASPDAVSSANGGGPEAGFADRIGRYLEEARRGGRLDALVLVAPADFLGPLRGALSRELRAALVGEIDGSRVGSGRDTLQAEVLRIL